MKHQGLPWWAWFGGALLLVGLIALVIWAIVDSGELDAEEAAMEPVVLMTLPGG